MDQTNSMKDVGGNSGFDLMAMISFDLKKVRKMLLDLQKDVKGRKSLLPVNTLIQSKILFDVLRTAYRDAE